MKYSIVTFGCRVNQADSIELEEALRVSGASRTSADQADLVVVNTCTVTASFCSNGTTRSSTSRCTSREPSAKRQSCGLPIRWAVRFQPALPEGQVAS